jgi:hypothetical protein
MASKKSSPVDEIDFDNYKIETSRAEQIREQIRRLKEIGWMEDLRLLAAELGQEESPSDESGQTELLGDAKLLVYRGAAGGPLQGMSVSLQGTEIVLRRGSQVLMEVLLLPKEGESAVLQVDSSLWAEVETLRDAFKDDLKLARHKKTDRQSKFRKAFGGADKAEPVAIAQTEATPSENSAERDLAAEPTESSATQAEVSAEPTGEERSEASATGPDAETSA